MSKTKVRAKWAADSIEPVLSVDASQAELSMALTWYNVMMDSKKSVKYVSAYLKENKINKVVPPSVPMQTASAVARLLSRGFVDKRLTDYMESWILRLEDKPVAPKTTAVVVSIQERMAEKMNEYVTGLDNAFEDFLESNYKMKFNTEKYLADSEVKASYIQGLVAWASSVRNEYVLSKTVPLMKEGYSTYTTPQKNKVIKFFDVMIDSLEKYRVAVAPKRKKKALTASKVVGKVKYAKVFPELKLKSVNPEKLVGATEVWLYNTTTRSLSYYTSMSGMSVSGTTLKDFDFAEQRKLRKPEDQLPMMEKSRKGKWVSKYNEVVKTKGSTPSGRLNSVTVILKVF